LIEKLEDLRDKESEEENLNGRLHGFLLPSRRISAALAVNPSCKE